MTSFIALTRRHTKLFFKDKGMFLTAMIAPLILLALFVAFLANTYRDSFVSSIPPTLEITESTIDGLIGSYLFSSLLAVSCVSVSFTANLVMVQDKASKARQDLTMAPIRNSQLSMSYYLSTEIISLIINYVTLGICFIYLSRVGFYMTGQDIGLTFLNIFMLTMFGTALSSFINSFLSTQGQMSAVAAAVSSAYGFICGGYIPISQMTEPIRKVISILPGTFGTTLVRRNMMNGYYQQLAEEGLPQSLIDNTKIAFDNELVVMDQTMTVKTMYTVMLVTIVLLIGLYLLLSSRQARVK